MNLIAAVFNLSYIQSTVIILGIVATLLLNMIICSLGMFLWRSRDYVYLPKPSICFHDKIRFHHVWTITDSQELFDLAQTISVIGVQTWGAPLLQIGECMLVQALLEVHISDAMSWMEVSSSFLLAWAGAQCFLWAWAGPWSSPWAWAGAPHFPWKWLLDQLLWHEWTLPLIMDPCRRINAEWIWCYG